MTRRTAEGSDPSLAIRGQDGLAHSEPLTPCSPPPPSQPGGEAERLGAHLRQMAEIDRSYELAVADFDSLLARAEAAEQKLIESVNAAEKWQMTALDLEQRLSAALGEVERLEKAAELLAPIKAVVQYLGNRDDPNWPSPHAWTVMAAFDSEDVAAMHAAECAAGTEVWEYRAVALSDPETALLPPRPCGPRLGAVISERDTAQALLRRVVEAVEPVLASVTPNQITAAQYGALLSINSDIRALLPSGTGEAEGEG